METQEWISVEIFCRQHAVAPELVFSLRDFGLLEIMHENDADLIPASQLGEAEKLLRLHEELDINLEGIDVIVHLLHRINAQQQEIVQLRNRLRFHEG